MFLTVNYSVKPSSSIVLVSIGIDNRVHNIYESNSSVMHDLTVSKIASPSTVRHWCTFVYNAVPFSYSQFYFWEDRHIHQHSYPASFACCEQIKVRMVKLWPVFLQFYIGHNFLERLVLSTTYLSFSIVKFLYQDVYKYYISYPYSITYAIAELKNNPTSILKIINLK